MYYGYIYKFTLIPTGKIYVGKRKGSIFDENYWGSGPCWKIAISQYDKTDILREVLEWTFSEEESIEKEKFWIKKLDATNPEIGYNLSDGGQTPILCGEKNGFYGKHHTEETKRINAEKHTGIKQSAETIEKRASKNRGQKRSSEQRARISAGQKGKHNHGSMIVKIKKEFYKSYKANDGILLWNDFQKQFIVTKEIEDEFNSRNKK